MRKDFLCLLRIMSFASEDNSLKFSQFTWSLAHAFDTLNTLAKFKKKIHFCLQMIYGRLIDVWPLTIFPFAFLDGGLSFGFDCERNAVG